MYSNVNYWPDKNKNDSSTLSQDSSFDVTQSSTITQPTQEHIRNTPGFGVTGSILILIMVFILRRN